MRKRNDFANVSLHKRNQLGRVWAIGDENDKFQQCNFASSFDTQVHLASDFKGRPFSILIMISSETKVCVATTHLMLLVNCDFYSNNENSKIKDVRIDDC